VGAVSISGHSMRFSDERIEKELVPLVLQAADDLSTRLGFHK
ncbi:MAG: IclR family transcriptional regulator, partial [Desulfuromonadales bacterium]|nr:IclR family transcriptional regulator [Desulfuromonadales bacterium]